MVAQRVKSRHVIAMPAPAPVSFDFQLPDWATAHMRSAAALPDLGARMRFVIEAARLNVERGTGGPFAAAVFERDTGVFVSLGVNLVETARASVLHAEIVALALAQKRRGLYDLSDPVLPAHELVSSAEPCAMCLGAVPWSGVKRLVCGARGEDVEKAGFDEGAKPDGWPAALARRGIEVVMDVERRQAADVVDAYIRRGGMIYNPAKSSL
jgi:tRNA(Arg) A34 adenosine deaminase TadA